MTNKIINEIKEIALKIPHINKVILFGSRARGDFNRKSDYDIAVFCSDEKSKIIFRDKIDNLKTLYKIDLIFIEKSHLKTKLYENIKKDGVIIMDKFANKLENFNNAFTRLLESVEESKQNDSLTIRDGVIQRFEFTTELAWKTTREYLISEGIAELNSPKAVMREAFSNNLIEDDIAWISLLDDRNITFHIYDEDQSEDIYNRIVNEHIAQFKRLLENLKAKK